MCCIRISTLFVWSFVAYDGYSNSHTHVWVLFFILGLLKEAPLHLKERSAVCNSHGVADIEEQSICKSAKLLTGVTFEVLFSNRHIMLYLHVLPHTPSQSDCRLFVTSSVTAGWYIGLVLWSWRGPRAAESWDRANRVQILIRGLPSSTSLRVPSEWGYWSERPSRICTIVRGRSDGAYSIVSHLNMASDIG